MTVTPPPFEVELGLDGWELFWARVELTPDDPIADSALADLRVNIAERVRSELAVKTLSSHPTIAALRSLLKAAGTDPTRYRASSESLLRRLLKGQDMPAVHPLVDLSNGLSASLLVPCSVVAGGSIEPPVVLRAGGPDDTYDSFRGPLKLAGKPLLADSQGPFDTPITSSRRTGARPETREAWIVAYLPSGVVQAASVATTLEGLATEAPVATIESVSLSA